MNNNFFLSLYWKFGDFEYRKILASNCNMDGMNGLNGNGHTNTEHFHWICTINVAVSGVEYEITISQTTQIEQYETNESVSCPQMKKK